MEKLILLLLIVFSISSCVTKSNQITKSKNYTTCPTDGTCSAQIIVDTRALIKKDEYGNSYEHLTKDTNYVLLKYAYDRNQLNGVADSHYHEIIYLSIPKDVKRIALIGQSMKQVELIYGRLCNCRNTTGYYYVNKGKVEVVKTDLGYDALLDIEVNNIPNVITELSIPFEF
ncbi:hypothetical protein A9Q93_03055 [Nonlabens dokdonensis]|uniref:Lipoprotein n=1 Tax=Nonlabens dokdonensis TaxID=328515 RepID=A0A1Z8B8D6_9FLAO|nr:hypothetical protein [Nonlabens dokdonensis]OUS18810.1 hypothetical protein A9Q93_03055 [Nonlabens dokdonensis]